VTVLLLVAMPLLLAPRQLHRRPFYSEEAAEAGHLPRLGPLRPAEPGAAVAREKGGDAGGPQVSDAVHARPREDDGIGQDGAPLGGAPLQVAQHHLAAGLVVAVVAERLHRLVPVAAAADEAGVAVPLLVVVDERLDQDHLTVRARPDVGAVDPDGGRHPVERRDDVRRAVNGFDVLTEEGGLEHRAGFELLGHARLVAPGGVRWVNWGGARAWRERGAGESRVAAARDRRQRCTRTTPQLWMPTPATTLIHTLTHSYKRPCKPSGLPLFIRVAPVQGSMTGDIVSSTAHIFDGTAF